MTPEGHRSSFCCVVSQTRLKGESARLAIELKEEKITTTPACRGHMCTLVTDRVEPETPNNKNFFKGR